MSHHLSSDPSGETPDSIKESGEPDLSLIGGTRDSSGVFIRKAFKLALALQFVDAVTRITRRSFSRTVRCSSVSPMWSWNHKAQTRSSGVESESVYRSRTE